MKKGLCCGHFQMFSSYYVSYIGLNITPTSAAIKQNGNCKDERSVHYLSSNALTWLGHRRGMACKWKYPLHAAGRRLRTRAPRHIIEVGKLKAPSHGTGNEDWTTNELCSHRLCNQEPCSEGSSSRRLLESVPGQIYFRGHPSPAHKAGLVRVRLTKSAMPKGN